MKTFIISENLTITAILITSNTINQIYKTELR